jgi:hypothetical protein
MFSGTVSMVGGGSLTLRGIPQMFHVEYVSVLLICYSLANDRKGPKRFPPFTFGPDGAEGPRDARDVQAARAEGSISASDR